MRLIQKHQQSNNRGKGKIEVSYDITQPSESTAVRPQYKELFSPSYGEVKELEDEPWVLNNEWDLYDVSNDPIVREFFEQDVMPRFKRANPNATTKQLEAVKSAYQIPVNYYKDDYTSAGGYAENSDNSIFYAYGIPLKSKANPKVWMNLKYKASRPVAVHEFTHGYRQGRLGSEPGTEFSVDKEIESNATKIFGKNFLGYTWEKGSGYNDHETQLLNDSYNMDGYNFEYPAVYEKGTTNSETRYRIWKRLRDQLGRVPTLEEVDNAIDNSGEELLKSIRDSNAYGNKAYQNGMDLEKVKNALKYVAQNTTNQNTSIAYAKLGNKLKN